VRLAVTGAVERCALAAAGGDACAGGQAAAVHLRLLLGWTPEAFEVSAEVFGVPEQPLNFAPPGVTFVAAEADALVLEDALAWVLAEADELSSAFFAWPLFSADAEVSVDADTDTVAVALAESLAA
jgi:hypothetical protein